MPFSNPFRAERLGGFLPFVWYGTRLSDWLRLLARGRYDVTLNRLPNIIGVTAMSPVSSFMQALSEARFRGQAEATDVVAPIFVLGHWRSGTTFLHNLLTRDPAFAYPTTFECVFPGGFLAGEKTFSGALSLFLPRKRPMDDVPMAADAPFEDEFALAKMGLPSPYAAMAFPRHGPPPLAHLDVATLHEAERRAWSQGLLWFLRRVQLAHPAKRLVMKSPPHTARIGTLLELFPDARFIHISRDPYAIYPSTLKLWKILNSRLGLQNPANDDGWLPGHVLSTLPAMYAAYERDLPLIPEGRLVEIRYEDLTADPQAVLASLYDSLGLGDFTQVCPLVETYLASLGRYEHRKSPLPEADRAAIERHWGFYFDRFGYGRMHASENPLSQPPS